MSAEQATRTGVWGRWPSWLPELSLVLALTLIAAFLRLWRLTEIPPGLHGDEANTGLDALRILREGWIGPYLPSGLGQPSGPAYWTALVFHLSEPTFWTLRFSMAVLGILTIPALYLWARIAFSRGVALVAAFLLTFSWWHLHFSHIAYMLIALPLVECLALAALFRTWQRPRLWSALLSGVLVGAVLYTYNGAPFFLLALLAILPLVAGAARSRWRSLLPSALLGGGCALLLAYPMLSFIVRHSETYFGRGETIGLSRDPGYAQADTFKEKAQVIVGETWQRVHDFYHRPRLDFTDATGQENPLSPQMRWLFPLGLAMAAFQIRQWRYALLIALLVTGAVAITLWPLAGGMYRRAISALPAIMVLSALPLGTLLEWRRVFSVPLRLMLYAGIALLLAFHAYWNVHYYFSEFPRSPATQWIFVKELMDPLVYVGERAPDSYVYFISGRWSFDYETRLFLYPDLRGEDRSEEFGQFSLERRHASPVAYLLIGDYTSHAEDLLSHYPGGRYYEVWDDAAGLHWAVYLLPPQESG